MWKTIFPRKWGAGGEDGSGSNVSAMGGDGSGGNGRDEKLWGASDEALLACPLLTSRCAAWILTGCRLGVGDPDLHD